MSATAPPVGIAMGEPAWLYTHKFTVKQVSTITATPQGTVNYWAGVADLCGFPLYTVRMHRRLFTAHGVYVIAILAAMAAAGVTIGNSVIKAVLETVHHDGQPRLPGLFDQLHLAEGFVTTEVELSQIWMEVSTKLEALHAQ